jgi:hypothetical protein
MEAARILSEIGWPMLQLWSEPSGVFLWCCFSPKLYLTLFSPKRRSKKMNRTRKGLMVAILMMLTLVPAMAETPSADVTFAGGSIAAGVGYTWGGGELHFNGKSFPFTVHGLSVVDVGVANIQGTGEVYNLKRVEDFPGNYVAAEAGATIAGGGTIAVLQNQNGVRIALHSTTQGLKLDLSANGVAVTLK